jgi:Zn-dependent protease with chaperone function
MQGPMSALAHSDLDVTEWVPTPARSARGAAWHLLWAVPLAAAGAAGAVVAGAQGCVIAAALAALALVVWIRVQGRLALRSVRALPLGATRELRWRHLVTGLAAAAATPAPSLWLIPEGGPNALVCNAGGPTIAVTQSLLDGYTRTELEAVAAHCLSRLKDSRAVQEAVALGPVGTRIAPFVGFAQDAAAVALTRYPPALASAIGKGDPRSGRFEAMWFVAEGPLHDPQAVRIEMLMDL